MLLTAVEPRVAELRERIGAGRAKSAVLKMRLGALADVVAQESLSTSFNPNLSGERIDALLATLFRKSTTDAMVAFEEPNVPQSIPLSLLKEKSPAV